MSVKPTKPSRSFVALGQRIFPILVISIILLVGFFGAHWFLPSDASHGDHATAVAPDVATDEPVVKLSPEKEAAGKIHASPIEMRELMVTKTFPGVVTYDESRHVELTAPVACLVKQTLVQPGQWVQPGEPLAILTSPDVGLARNEVKRCQAELTLARMELEWAQQTNSNLRELLALLEQSPSVREVESELEGKVLGEHRDDLISAYSQYLLATRVVSRSNPLEVSGALTGRVVEQRESDREIAAARFRGISEESQFQSERDLVKAKAVVESSERSLESSRDKLLTLLGPYGTAEEQEHASDFELRAPIAGRIEQLDAVNAARFQVGDQMIVLADTNTVWIAAQIRQRDWDALQIDAGHKLDIAAPALPEQALVGTVKFVGSTVSPTTLAVPLVAEIANPDGALRPGMFVWVDVPISTSRRVLAVAASAIQRQEGQPFVFIREDDHRYRRVDIQIASETPSWVEVVAGLQQGMLVVDEGAFYLTSELLLEEE